MGALEEWERRARKTFELVRLADVEPKAIDWLWPGYLARGKLTLIGGDPGLGKSLITIDAAARQSRGHHWPHGPRARVAGAVLVCSEDGIDDTVRPRVEAAGADLELVHVVKGAHFSLQDDLDMLADLIKGAGNISLVSFDAITSYMGRVDGHSTTDVRAVLEPITTWAEHLGVAVLGVTHPPKAANGSAINAFTGSLAYVAAPRVVLLVTKEPDSDRVLLLPVKVNIGMPPLGLAYRVTTKTVAEKITAPHLLWDDAPVDYTANSAIAANHAALKGGDAMQDAREFLREMLADGPADAKQVIDAAEANCISERTLKRAKKELGVKVAKKGIAEGWQWSL